LFVVVYHYQIPIEKTVEYITLEKKAVDIYLENGCIAIEIYRNSEQPDKWMEINRFEDKEHYERVVATLSDDPRISRLFTEFQDIFEKEIDDPEKNLYFQMI
jgi:quinol monooxygenase YgiN